MDLVAQICFFFFLCVCPRNYVKKTHIGREKKKEHAGLVSIYCKWKRNCLIQERARVEKSIKSKRIRQRQRRRRSVMISIDLCRCVSVGGKRFFVYDDYLSVCIKCRQLFIGVDELNIIQDASEFCKSIVCT